MQTPTFTHQPQPPKRVPVLYPEQRYFMELYQSGLTLDVMRFESRDITDLNFTLSSQGGRITFTQKLTADQCEALARALIDAAHDIRTHNPATTPTDDTEPVETTAWPFPPATGPVPWTAAQVAAHASQQRESVGEALL
jgi:hypothetical protein